MSLLLAAPTTSASLAAPTTTEPTAPPTTIGTADASIAGTYNHAASSGGTE